VSEPQTTGPSKQEIETGAAVYTEHSLSRYDFLVLGVVSRWIWHCKRKEMLAVYSRNIGEHHLDLGPGTGFFLDRCDHRSAHPRIALVDLNSTVLTEAQKRLRRYAPTTYKRDVLSPFELDGEKFDSVGLNFLLHCLPGSMEHKAQVFDHARVHLLPGGRIFGSTVLAKGVTHSKGARKALEALNQNGTFNNRDDSYSVLDAELARRFRDYRLTIRGSVALFEIST
jgi:ubiquinone/menaquinone biosynthesis C-methylase UbiE